MVKKAAMKMATTNSYDQALKKKKAYLRQGYSVDIEKYKDSKGKPFYKVYAAYLKRA